MRPIVAQRRLAEIGRIRAGERGPKGEPRKLDRWRLTSRDEGLLRRAAELWGGQVRPWDSPDGPQHQVTLDVSALPVLVAAGTATITRAYERWDGPTLAVRCDGVTRSDGAPCDCEPERPACTPTTRLRVLLPDLRAVGSWTLVSRGWHALAELGGVEALLASQPPGRLLPGWLRLEQRSARRRGDGRAQTLRWAVPVLQLDAAMLPEVGPAPEPVPPADPAPPLEAEPASLEAPPAPEPLGVAFRPGDAAGNARALTAVMRRAGLTAREDRAAWWAAWGGPEDLGALDERDAIGVARALELTRAGHVVIEDGRLVDQRFGFVVARDAA